MTPPSPAPHPLARFPDAVRAAFDRHAAAANAADLNVVIEAALREFMPKRPGATAPERLADGQRLIEDLGFDSLAVAELVFFFEDLFRLSIQTQEIMELSTVGQLRAFVERKLASRAAVA